MPPAARLRDSLGSASPATNDRVAVALLLIAVAAAFANTFAGGFQFDDFNVIVRESSAQSVSAWLRSQPGIRPLLKLSYALNHDSGFGLLGFHAVNLAIHAANVLLVWALLRRLAGADGGEIVGQRRAALFAAAVFALHPVQTEAVTYLSGRSTALAALFALLSIWLWLRGRAAREARDLHLWSPLALAAALACKEFAVVVPVVLLLCASVQAQEPGWLHSAWQDSRAHWFVLVVALAAACAVPRYRLLLETSLATRDVATNLLTQAQALSYLVGQLLRIDSLNADPALPVVTGFDIVSITPALAWFALLCWGLMAPRRHRVAAFGLLWFLLWLAPTNSILPRLDVVNDRQLYVALVGPAYVLAWCCVRYLRSAAQAWILVLVGAVLAASTWQRNHVYADEIAYWGDVAHKAPHNARAFANLGHALALRCNEVGARSAFEIALQLDPGQYQAAIKLRLMREGGWPGVQPVSGTLPGRHPGVQGCGPKLRDESATRPEA